MITKPPQAPRSTPDSAPLQDHQLLYRIQPLLPIVLQYQPITLQSNSLGNEEVFEPKIKSPKGTSINLWLAFIVIALGIKSAKGKQLTASV